MIKEVEEEAEVKTHDPSLPSAADAFVLLSDVSLFELEIRLKSFPSPLLSLAKVQVTGRLSASTYAICDPVIPSMTRTKIVTSLPGYRRTLESRFSLPKVYLDVTTSLSSLTASFSPAYLVAFNELASIYELPKVRH